MRLTGGGSNGKGYGWYRMPIQEGGLKWSVRRGEIIAAQLVCWKNCWQTRIRQDGHKIR